MKRPRIDVWPDLPEKVFISYSYDDEAGKEKLLARLRRLPRRIEAETFPFEEPEPQRAVSNGVVPRILSCGGLIYLAGGQSENSLWVNFECDYARRAGRKVFAFDASDSTLRVDERLPIPLRVNLVIGEGDEGRAEALLRWMKEERHFEFSTRPIRARLKEIPGLVANWLHEQQVVLWLMNAHLHGVAHHSMEVPIDRLYEAYGRTYNAWYTHDEADFSHYAAWLVRHSMFARLNADWQPRAAAGDAEVELVARELFPVDAQFQRPWAVDLVSPDGNGLDWNRADDLIVRVTLMLRMAEPFFPDDTDPAV